MEFTEQLRVPVSAAEAWEFLWQTERLAACLPGCVEVQEVEPRKSYRARFQDHIGPHKIDFWLDVVVPEAVPRERIRLKASGQDRRLGVSQTVDLEVKLRAEGPSETVLDVVADVQVLGKVATLGQFVIKRKAREVVKQLAQNIDAALKGPLVLSLSKDEPG